MTALDFAHDIDAVSTIVGLVPPKVTEQPAKTYKILDLSLRTEITGGLSLGDAWRLHDFLKGQDPLLRLDIRTEFN